MSGMDGWKRWSFLALALLAAFALPGCWRGNCDCEEVEEGVDEDETLALCPPVDIVFIMDTSGSMDDEADALCAAIMNVQNDLMARGLTEIRSTILGIVNAPGIEEPGAANSAPTSGYDCLTNTVYRVVGGDGVNHPIVPGVPPGPETVEVEPGEFQFVDPTHLDPTNEESEEYWAPATALIAQNFPWLPNPSTGPPTIRIIVVLSDESGQTGAQAAFPIDDLAVQNAIQVAITNNVILSPLLGTPDGPRDPAIGQHMAMMANQTGGTFVDSTLDPNFDVAESIFLIVEEACEHVTAPEEE